MASFSDRKGREWDLSLDVFLVEKIHARTGSRIDRLIDNKLADLQDLVGDLVKFGKFLWVICEEQAEQRGVTPEEFARGFNGCSLQRAADALVTSIADFIPPHQSAVLTALMGRAKELTEQSLARVRAEIAAWSPTPSTPVTPAAPSSDSTPSGAD